MYVGVISDTHGVFSKEFADFLAPVDVIWHAGDWGGSLGFVQQIRDLGKPIVGVYGNCDGLDIRQEFPEYQFFREEGLGILLTHIGGSPGHYYPRAQQLIRACKPDIFVCGHSHILKVQWDDGRGLGYASQSQNAGGPSPASSLRQGFLYMNPGAAGLQGWQVVRTALRFKLGPAPEASPAPASPSPSPSPAGSSTPSAAAVGSSAPSAAVSSTPSAAAAPSVGSSTPSAACSSVGSSAPSTVVDRITDLEVFNLPRS